MMLDTKGLTGFQCPQDTTQISRQMIGYGFGNPGNAARLAAHQSFHPPSLPWPYVRSGSAMTYIDAEPTSHQPS
jgi:hypothetical protein